MAISFGPGWQHELWASPYRLRFALNQGGSYVNMFTSSYDRARVLARAALPADEVVAIVATFPNPKRELGAKWRGWTKGTALELLEKMGVTTEPALAAWTGYWWAHEEADDEATPWAQRAFRLIWHQADILLWNQVAYDMGVTPQAPVLSKLVDVEHGVSVNAYNDRGMDITALSPDPIAELYIQFDSCPLRHFAALQNFVAIGAQQTSSKRNESSSIYEYAPGPPLVGDFPDRQPDRLPKHLPKAPDFLNSRPSIDLRPDPKKS